MRTYERTHPWITFNLDLRRADYKLWLFLGEAQSKCEHISGVPLLPSVAAYLHQVYLAKGVLATTAIEGNTLTEEEVKQRLEGKLKLPPSKEYLGQEVDNIVEACNQIGNRIFSEGRPVELCVSDIKNYNLLVLKNLPLEEEVVPGEIRKHDVGVARYKGAPPQDCEYLLKHLCDWLNGELDTSKGNEIAFGTLKAIIAHVYIAWIHPFSDGNGRTARLIELQILLSSGVPSAAAHLLSNHYKKTRSEYYRQLDYTHKSNGDIFPFIQYALQGYVDGLREQIEVMQYQQRRVLWEKYVHDKFKGKNSKTDMRKKQLILDLSSKSEIIPLSEVRHVSPIIAEFYATKTDKALKRDINALKEMDLIEKSAKGIRAKQEVILAFMPPSVKIV